MRRKGQQAENDKTERVTGLGRRLRKEIAKWNQMTALTFQTGGDIRHPQPPFGGQIQSKWPGSVALKTKKSLHSTVKTNVEHNSNPIMTKLLGPLKLLLLSRTLL